MDVTVETYSGYKADERPVRFYILEHAYEVRQVLDTWYGPDDTWFKVEADDGRHYILRYRPSGDQWTLEALPNL